MCSYGRHPAWSAKVSHDLESLLHHVDLDHVMFVFPHTTEQGSQHVASLISKQAVPFQTYGGTYCPGMSTPKIWSLADSSNHILWRT
jgi:hypothetical protein